MNHRFSFLCCFLLFIVHNAFAQDAPAPVAPLPSPQQVAWQQMETYAFIHFGTNTFGDREWGYGDAPAASFNPERLDCEQWARTLKAAGMRGVIITAKHHDGFCLWPSRHTDYSVAASPFRGGKGDVVGELAAACKKYGLKMGVYLSPWDRHQATYGTPDYVEYFHAQLEELTTNYGPLFEMWFDGANGGDGYYGGAREQRTIDRRTYYDLPRAFQLLARKQPDIIIFSDGGPGCRWVGNEKGFAGETNWSFLRKGEVYPGYERFQELNSGHVDGNTWVAAECDVSIRPGWFYHESEDSLVKSVDDLCDIYYRSVGRNGTFLLNFPVDRDGLIHPIDSARAVAFHDRIAAELRDNLLTTATVKATDTRGKAFAAKNVVNGHYDSYWATHDGTTTATLTFTFRQPQRLNRFMLQEYIPLGQRVKAFVLEYLDGGRWQPVRVGEATTTIGYKRLLRFDDITATALRVRFTEARGPLCISTVGAFYAQRDINQRAHELCTRMTLEEKVGQLRCTMAWNYYERTVSGDVVPSEAFKKDIDEGRIGMLWATFRADPWTQKTLDNGLNPPLAAEAANALQRYAIEHSRLGIPLFLAEEAPHGHMAIGTTVFPTGLAMAATWSPELIEQAGKVIAKEIRAQGAHISYGPVLDLARDPRWSRVEETFGEDPVLTATLGAAMVRGLGGGNLSKPDATLATLKHFVAYGASDGGQNGGATHVGPRELQEMHFRPFHRALEAGALSVMTAYTANDGIPCTANPWLLTDVLRRQWGFRGFVVSDLYAIDGLAGTHRVAADRQDAALQALRAGVDVDLGATAYNSLIQAVRNGAIAEAAIDSAMERVLRLKFEMGLFEHPYVDPQATRDVGSHAHRDASLAIARAAVTLLKNNILPLSKNTRVLVCGPNADNRYNQLGDYTAPQPDGAVVTILDGIRSKLPANQVQYVRGCAVRDTTESRITEAVAAAAEADVVIACVGGSSARDFRSSYEATGAATAATLSDMDCGEGFDRATLDLLGHQQRLLEALKATGKPLVVIYIEGRPLDKRWAADNADALLTAYYPGAEGGTAIADVLFGDYNPAGRLPVSVPRHVGQLPVYYNRPAPLPHNYIDLDATPLYPFGYGLSYTTFNYDNLLINGQSVSVDITNTGSRDGDEVVQLYLHPEVATTVQPVMQLLAFQRLFVPKGETRTATFTLPTPLHPSQSLSTSPNPSQPLPTTLLIGSSSADIRLRATITPISHD